MGSIVCCTCILHSTIHIAQAYAKLSISQKWTMIAPMNRIIAFYHPPLDLVLTHAPPTSSLMTLVAL